MANVITVIGERDKGDVDQYYVVTDNGWRRLGKTTRKADLIQSAVLAFEKQIQSGSVLVVAHLGNELAYTVKFEAGMFAIEEMDFDEVEW
ncbi:hypothetical protein LCGC14_2606870 [marine sediment metagenome]|uniref:Uncharacterized protein n=1 Tax=marine sediment metagenome TaxID=412755 RepID=A0A0F9CZU1_9ZZZZ